MTLFLLSETSALISLSQLAISFSKGGLAGVASGRVSMPASFKPETELTELGEKLERQ